MQVKVSNQVIVKNFTDELLKWCEKNLVLPNPEYYQKEKMGLRPWNTPKTIVLYAVKGNDLLLPFGCLNYIWSKYKNTCDFERQIAEIRHVDYQSSINLYGYQEKAVNEALRSKNGVVIMPCGAGKTQTALEIIARIGGKALWLTHTKDLLNQSMSRAKEILGIDKSTYGTITDGKINIGTGITFATVQTMARIDLLQYKDDWDVIVVDECHRAIGSPTKIMQFYKVLSNLSCRYKFGVTATPKRADGLEKSMFALLGEKIIDIPKEEIADRTCDVYVKFIETHYMPNIDKILMADGTIDYTAVIYELTHDEERFIKVLNEIEKLPKEPTLVLANRVEYLQNLCTQYDGECVCMSAKTPKEKRKTALAALNDGELDCIFATYQLAKEGLDVPNLRYIVFATPEQNETTVVQAAGRVARVSDGKTHGTIIDFVDEFSLHKGWKKKREKYYRKLGYVIDND